MTEIPLYFQKLANLYPQLSTGLARDSEDRLSQAIFLKFILSENISWPPKKSVRETH